MWCSLDLWLLGLKAAGLLLGTGTLLLRGCSHSLVLFGSVAAQLSWCSPVTWLLVRYGALVTDGCFGTVVFSSLLAAGLLK